MPIYRTASTVYAVQLLHQATRSASAGGYANTSGMGTNMPDRRLVDSRATNYLGLAQPNVDEYLIQYPALDSQESDHIQTAENVDLVQHNILAVDNATQAHTAETVGYLTQNLVVQDATQAQTVENIGYLTQNLDVQDATQD